MAARSLREMQALRPRELTLSGVVVIGAAGAITFQGALRPDGTVLGGAKQTGATVTKTAAKSGRYAIAFDRNYRRIKECSVVMVGPDDTAFPTTTGSQPQTRLLTTSGFSAQFVRQDTQADADPASGTKFTWSAIVALE